VTRLLRELRGGNDAAREELWSLVYDELRRLAGHYMKHERAGHTLQATALVHEAYVNLVGSDVTASSRVEFLGLAARAMRNILVDHARRRGRAKRGGDAARLTLDEGLLEDGGSPDELVALDQALDGLARQDERKARVVELHFFGGLTYEEIAGALGVSLSTVRVDMRFSRAWLRAALEGD